MAACLLATAQILLIFGACICFAVTGAPVWSMYVDLNFNLYVGLFDIDCVDTVWFSFGNKDPTCANMNAALVVDDLLKATRAMQIIASVLSFLAIILGFVHISKTSSRKVSKPLLNVLISFIALAAVFMMIGSILFKSYADKYFPSDTVLFVSFYFNCSNITLYIITFVLFWKSLGYQEMSPMPGAVITGGAPTTMVTQTTYPYGQQTVGFMSVPVQQVQVQGQPMMYQQTTYQVAPQTQVMYPAMMPGTVPAAMPGTVPAGQTVQGQQPPPYKM